MDFQQQVNEIAKIQKEFGDCALPILMGLKDADATLMKNKGIRFLKHLLAEIEKDGKKAKYDAFDVEDFVYVTSRMDGTAKQQITDLANDYADGRITIANS